MENNETIDTSCLWKGRSRVDATLAKLGVETYQGLAQLTKKQVMEVEGCGDTTFRTLVNMLNTKGLRFKVEGMKPKMAMSEPSSDWRDDPKSWFWLLTEWQKDQNPEKINEALQNLKRLGYKIDIEGKRYSNSTQTQSPEREVWAGDLLNNNSDDIGFLTSEWREYQDDDTTPEPYNLLCHNSEDRFCNVVCVAFTVKDGYACCKMMCGDKIIGKLIEPPTEEM